MKVRTSVLRGFALLALSSLAFTACDDKNPTVVVPPEITITVTPQSAQLQVGQTTNFVAVVGGSANQTVTWSSSTPAVATVNASTGAVTAVTPGTTTITATSAADATKRAAAQVIVVAAPPAPVVNVAVVPNAASMLVGQTLQLVPVVTNATNTAVTYASLDGAVASVSPSGVVTAVGAGTAVIRVTSVQDPSKSATAVITVSAVTPPPPPAVTVTLVPGAATVAVGGTVQFTAASSAPNDVITYTSSNPNVLSVGATTGLATGVAVGNAVVTARSTVNPNAVATAAVTVTAVAPPPPVTLSVTPTAASMVIGDTLNLAVTSSAANDVITFTSSNQNVVSVDANGRLIAIAAGNAIITARSTVNPNSAVTVSVSVTQAPPETQPSISIQSITTAFGVPVPANNPAPGVGGALNVTVNVSAGSATQISAVEVRFRNIAGGNAVVACTQTFSPPLAPTQGVAQIVCPVNTADINPDGTALWVNGTYEVTARAMANVNGTPTQVAQATYGNIRIFNADVAAVTISTTGANAIGGATSVLPGQRWDEGNVVVTVTPAMYSGNTVASTRVCLNANGTAIPTANSVGVPAGTICRQVTGPVNNVFTATFPKSAAHSVAAAGVAGVEAQNFTASVTTLTTAGSNGPIGTSNAINLDNQAPVVTNLTINPNQYVNGAFAFGGAAGCGAAPYTGTCFAMNDLGSDSQTVVFNVQTTGGVTVNNGANVANPSGLDETSTSTQRILQAVVTDAVGNTRTVYGTAPGFLPSTTVAGASQFGIDLTAPSIAFASGPANGSTNPTSNTYDFTFLDAGVGPSGFSATPLQIRVQQYTPDGLGNVSVACIHPTTGVQLAGAGAGCTTNGGFVTVADGNPDVILPFAGVDAYFQVTGRVRDFAGNLSSVEGISRTTLDDQVAPVVGNIITPTSITGGTSVTFSAQMQDNVELGDQLGYVGYNAIGAFLVTSLDVLGLYGFDELSTPRNATHTVDQFIRSIETTAGGAPSGAIAMATDMNLAVRDLAGRQTATLCPAAGTQTAVQPAGPFTLTGSCRTVQTSIVNAINLGMGGTAETSWSSANRPFGPVTGTNPNGGGTAFTHTSSAAPVCSNTPVGANAGCNVVTATSKTLTATATGPAQTFANPFSRVEFYYTDAANRSIRIGTGSVTVTDNTVTNIRTWTYTTSWTPTGVVASAGYPVFAVGVDAQGRALMSNTVVVPVTSD